MLLYIDDYSRMRLFNVMENREVDIDVCEVQGIGYKGHRSVDQSGPYRLFFYDGSNLSSHFLFLYDLFGGNIYQNSDDNRCYLLHKDQGYTIATLNIAMLREPTLSFSFEFETDAFVESFVFLRHDGQQHLQFVTKYGFLVRYRIDEEHLRWNRV